MITEAQRQEAARMARSLSYLSKMMTFIMCVRMSYGRRGVWLTFEGIEESKEAQ